MRKFEKKYTKYAFVGAILGTALYTLFVKHLIIYPIIAITLCIVLFAYFYFLDSQKK